MASLFEPDLPDGFAYRAEFISEADERAVVAAIAAQVQFASFEMRGVIARRRVAFFGASSYAAAEGSGDIPAFLLPLLARTATWAGVDADAFRMALINEYPPGATIGWHRDAPQYDIIAGISLLSPCRMKLRPYVAPRQSRAAGRAAPRRTTHELTLETRSGYLIAGKARSDFEHSIPATTALRYSITFRTLR